MKLDVLIEKIEEWGSDRGILQNGTQLGQMTKVFEEVTEALDAISLNDEEALADAIGDSVVTLVMLAGVSKLDFTNCVAKAYNEIKDRKGYLRDDGVFVKETK